MSYFYETETRMASLDFIHACRGVFGYMGSWEQRAFMYHLGLASQRGAEIGSLCGLSAVLVGMGMKGSGGTYYCIDTFQASNAELEHRDTLQEWKTNIQAHGLEGVCLPIVGWSYDQAVYDQVPDGLDFVYVDGDHEFKSILQDALLYRRKLRQGGLLVFHDTPWKETQKAIAVLTETRHMTLVRMVDDFGIFRTTERTSDLELLNVNPVG